VKKYFTIIGGQNRNKGSQAMVLSIVQELKKRFDDCHILVLLSDNVSPPEYFNFESVLVEPRLIFRLLLGKFKFILGKSKFFHNENKIAETLKKTDTIFDVSGFALSSKFTFNNSLYYLSFIALAKKYNTKIVLLPQSFGPFDYQGLLRRTFLHILKKKYLKFPHKIFAREEKSYNAIEKYTNNNLVKCMDIVFISSLLDKSVVFKDRSIDSKKYSVLHDGYALLIPSVKLVQWNKDNNVMYIYNKIINEVVSNSLTVYLVMHSMDDKKLCLDLIRHINKENKGKVFFISEEINAIDIYSLISNANLVISSRYHGVVHSYKANVPTLIIGWSDKYKELADRVKQGKYYYDIRNFISSDELTLRLKTLIELREVEKNNIIKSKQNFLEPERNKMKALFQELK